MENWLNMEVKRITGLQGTCLDADRVIEKNK